MEEEIWKDIEGYDHPYQVSNFGRVKRLTYTVVTAGKKGPKSIIYREKFFEGSIDFGYRRVKLVENGKRHKVFVHKLVAEAFIPNPQKLPYINHKDENKSNNHYENLEWCTCEYNLNYGTCQHRKVSTRTKLHIAFKKCFYEDENGNVLVFDRITDLSNHLGYTIDHVSRVLNGKKKFFKPGKIGYCD